MCNRVWVIIDSILITCCKERRMKIDGSFGKKNQLRFRWNKQSCPRSEMSINQVPDSLSVFNGSIFGLFNVLCIWFTFNAFTINSFGKPGSTKCVSGYRVCMSLSQAMIYCWGLRKAFQSRSASVLECLSPFLLLLRHSLISYRSPRKNKDKTREELK